MRTLFVRLGTVIVLSVLLAGSAAAQFTLVTGTVTDPNGVPYALGTIVPTLVTSGTPKFAATGTLYFPPNQASGLDGNGHFLVQLADNTFLSPGGTQWNFKVCSAIGTVPLAFGTGPQCFSLAAPITISGATQDISTNLHAVALALTLPFGSGTGTIGGSGTAGFVPVFATGTTLGNSLIQSGTGIFLGNTGTPLTNPIGLSSNSVPTPSACGGSNAVPLPVFGCIGSRVAFTNDAGTTADVSAGLYVKSLPSNFVAGTLGVGIATQVQAPFNETETRAGYFEAYENVTSTVTTRRGLFAFAANGTGNTTATNEGAVFQTGAQGGTNTNDFTAHILSPDLNIGGLGGVLTTHVGLQIEDQTIVGVGTNSNPFSIRQVGNAPNAFQGHLNQTAAGNWAGTCTMSTTTCTITLTVAYTGVPGCVATVQGTTAIAAACSVAGTTVTITAASSNTATWAAMLFGNPN
jgi:hypothetical protein